MLAIGDVRGRLGRRDFLRIGGLTLGGLSLPGLLAARAAAAQAGMTVTDKSVIFLFLHGGPSQIETFDPKMTAPAGHPQRHRRGRRPRCPASPSAARSRSWPSWPTSSTVVRSFVTGDGNHDIKPIVGRDTLGANLGSLYSPRRRAEPPGHRHADQRRCCSRGRSIRRRSRAPSSVRQVRRDRPARRGLRPVRARRRRRPAEGHAAHAADATGSTTAATCSPSLDRVQARRSTRPSGSRASTRCASRRSARSSAASPRRSTCRRKTRRRVARYDTAPLVRPEQISRKWNNYNNYVDNAKIARQAAAAGPAAVRARAAASSR